MPAIVGLAGVILAPRDRPSALSFALEALALSAVLVPAALERLAME